MTKDWSRVRDEIIHLYTGKKMKLEDVKDSMERHHDFKASIRAYRTRLKKWGVHKYSRHKRQSEENGRQGLGLRSEQHRWLQTQRSSVSRNARAQQQQPQMPGASSYADPPSIHGYDYGSQGFIHSRSASYSFGQPAPFGPGPFYRGPDLREPLPSRRGSEHTPTSSSHLAYGASTYRDHAGRVVSPVGSYGQPRLEPGYPPTRLDPAYTDAYPKHSYHPSDAHATGPAYQTGERQAVSAGYPAQHAGSADQTVGASLSPSSQNMPLLPAHATFSPSVAGDAGAPSQSRHWPSGEESASPSTNSNVTFSEPLYADQQPPMAQEQPFTSPSRAADMYKGPTISHDSLKRERDPENHDYDAVYEGRQYPDYQHQPHYGQQRQYPRQHYHRPPSAQNDGEGEGTWLSSPPGKPLRDSSLHAAKALAPPSNPLAGTKIAPSPYGPDLSSPVRTATAGEHGFGAGPEAALGHAHYSRLLPSLYFPGATAHHPAIPLAWS